MGVGPAKDHVAGEGVHADQARAVVDGLDHAVFNVLGVFHCAVPHDAAGVDAALGRGAEEGVDRVVDFGEVALAQDGVKRADKATCLVAPLGRPSGRGRGRGSQCR